MANIFEVDRTNNIVIVGTTGTTLRLPFCTGSRLAAFNGDSDVISTDLNSWITGTANQITVTDDGDGTVTLSTDLGGTYQPLDAVLTDLAALDVVADNEFIVGTGAGVYAHESGATARTSLGVAIGTNVQAWDASLDSIAALTYASDSFIKVTAEDTYAIRTIVETKTDLSLNLVENTALSTWVGTTNITTLGTISTVGNITIADGGTIGQAAGPLLTFDDTNNYLEITGCKVGIGIINPTEELQIGTNGTNARSICGLLTYNDQSAYSSAYWTRKSNSDTLGTLAETQSGDVLGEFGSSGVNSNNDNWASGAYLAFVQNGAASPTRVPTDIHFLTSPGGAVAPTIRMVIKNDGGLALKEQASAGADTAAYGQIWCKTAVPNELWFTNDVGTDLRLDPQDLQITASPTFAGLTLSSTWGHLQIYESDATTTNRNWLIDANNNTFRISAANDAGDTIDQAINITRSGVSISDIRFLNPIKILEQAAADVDTAAYGQLWVKSDTPNILMFTDDAGNDFTVDVTAV